MQTTAPRDRPASRRRAASTAGTSRSRGSTRVQGVVILALSFAKSPLVTAPVVSSFLTFDTATKTLVPAQRALFDLPIGPAVALFFFLSAIAHFAVAFPARGWYERSLARGQNPARWIEYALSSSVMIVVIATLSGIQEIGTLRGDLRHQRGDEPVRLEHGARERGPDEGAVVALRLRLHRRASFPGS